MQVFKTYMKILKKNLPVAMIYIIVFGILLMIMAKTSNSTTDYTDVSMTISIFDEDESEASKALCQFLDEKYEVVSIPRDENRIMDAVFYCQIDYALIIKDGYGEKTASGEMEGLFENYKDPSGSSSMIIDNFLNEYVKCMSAYQTAGLSAADAAEKTAESLSDGINVTIENFSDNESGAFTESYQFFFQFFAYIIICVFMNTVCPVLLKLNRSDLKKRVNSSCVPQFSQALQTMLGSAVVFAGIWVILVIAGTIIGGGSFSTMNMLAIVNSFVFALVAAGITLLCSVLIKEPKIINVVTNILGLGMSFLCGVFVPQELLGEGVLSAARFLPAYWYIRSNNMLAGTAGEIYSSSDFMINTGVQLAFAAVLFLSYILISRIRYKEEGV